MFFKREIRKLGPLYKVAYVALTPILSALTRPHWAGSENVPKSGAIIVSNHLSNFDPLTIAYAFGIRGHEVRFLAKAELFRVPVLGKVLNKWGMVPVERQNGNGAKALDHAAAALAKGQIIVIYPEGTITTDPAFWPMKAKTGAARLALDTGAPVVPVLQWGTQDIMDRHTPNIRWAKSNIYTRVLPALDLSDLPQDSADREAVREATERIMNTLRTGLGELRGEVPPERVWDPALDEAPLSAWGPFASWRRQLARRTRRQDILPGRGDSGRSAAAGF